jgi:hypothetical protein
MWSDSCQQAFDKLKQAFVSPELMAYPRDTGDFILDTDACDTAIGAVLSQIQDGHLRVIAYFGNIIRIWSDSFLRNNMAQKGDFRF